MKKLVIILTILLGTTTLAAQTEIKQDSLKIAVGPKYNMKAFGDFVLDMNLLTPPKLPSFSSNLLGPDMTKDYNALFILPFQQITTYKFTHSNYQPYGYGFFSTSQELQGATFKLNGNMKISTYGQYTLDGRKIPQRGALPWEKNDFIGGMELKFNKNFGIQIEVRQRHNPLFPY